LRLCESQKDVARIKFILRILAIEIRHIFTWRKINAMIKPKIVLLLSILSFYLTGCDNNSKLQYKKELSDWRATRLERLKSKTGWLNLAGLYWLKEVENTIGSDSSNSIVFPPNTSPFYGSLRLMHDSILFKAALGAEVSVDGEPTKEKLIASDANGKPSILQAGNIAWTIIKRDGKYAIRLRDYKHPRIAMLDSIPAYKPKTDWRIVADYVPFDTIRKIETRTMIGGTETNDCPGKLFFEKGKEKYTLFPFTEGDGFFIIFADETNGIETYGNGRFMYTSLPDSSNKVVLDFNKAYNPPCAFSPFATCPKPPKENILNLKVDAGEKEIHLE
jgi:uncharacterized protein